MTEAEEEKRITTEYGFLHVTNFRNEVRNHGVFIFKIAVWEKIVQQCHPLISIGERMCDCDETVQRN